MSELQGSAPPHLRTRYQSVLRRERLGSALPIKNFTLPTKIGSEFGSVAPGAKITARERSGSDHSRAFNFRFGSDARDAGSDSGEKNLRTRKKFNLKKKISFKSTWGQKKIHCHLNELRRSWRAKEIEQRSEEKRGASAEEKACKEVSYVSNLVI